MGPTWGPPGSCRPQMGPMLAPWTLLSGLEYIHAVFVILFHANDLTCDLSNGNCYLQNFKKSHVLNADNFCSTPTKKYPFPECFNVHKLKSIIDHYHISATCRFQTILWESQPSLRISFHFNLSLCGHRRFRQSLYWLISSKIIIKIILQLYKCIWPPQRLQFWTSRNWWR